MIIETHAQYHANAAVSHSKLEVFRRRPRLYQMRYVTRELPAPEPTAAFRIGSATHCAVLEPEKFPTLYAQRPEGIDRRTKEGKAAWESFTAQHSGKDFLDAEEWAQISAMMEAVRANPLASQLLAQGTPELSWRVETGAIPLQCRTDWFNPKGCELSAGRPYVADLKTIESLDADAFRSFERAAFTYGYHRQAGFYLPLITEIIGAPVTDFFFIAVEKQAPYGVAVFRLTDEAVATGQDESLADLRRLKICRETNVWPNIEPEVTELGLPKWYAGGAR
jgi:hypothetical protein